MAVTIADRANDCYGVDITLADGSPLIPRGIGVAHNATDLLANTLATGGFKGVMIAQVEANTSGLPEKVRVTVATSGEVEALAGATPIVKGNPLTLDTTNRFIPATAGQLVVARAVKDIAANTYGLIQLDTEGIL